MTSKNKNKTAKNKMIYYTGIGAKKSGRHTKKEYLEMMNKQHLQKCAIYYRSLKCKPCQKSRKMHTDNLYTQIEYHKKINHISCRKALKINC